MDDTASSEQFKPIAFNGTAREYFSIWIVNVLLTILTLGIYSAWAKVRTNQYFYGNTVVDGASFRYLADPVQILKGRIAAAALFAAYYFSGLISPMATGLIVLIIALLLPALVVMSMSFQLRNTAYRNIRFNFVKDYKRAYTLFAYPLLFVLPYIGIVMLSQPDEFATSEQEMPETVVILLTVLPLLIANLYPLWEYTIIKFKATHSRFGTTAIEFDGRGRSLYGIYLAAGLIMILMMILAGVGMAVLFTHVAPGSGDATTPPDPMFAYFSIIAFLPAYLLFFAYVYAKKINFIFNNLDIGGNRIRSELKVGYMLYLYFTNTLAIALSLGLLMPWARVRSARYRASVTSVVAVDRLEEFIADQVGAQSAFGEEIGDVLDMDLGI